MTKEDARNTIAEAWALFLVASVALFSLGMAIGVEVAFSVIDGLTLLVAVYLLLVSFYPKSYIIIIGILSLAGLVVKSVIFAVMKLDLLLVCKGSDSHICHSDTMWSLFAFYYVITLGVAFYAFKIAKIMYFMLKLTIIDDRKNTILSKNKQN